MSHPKRRRQHRPHFHRRTGPGAPPGLLVPDLNAPQAEASIIAYGPQDLLERRLDDIRHIPPLLKTWPVTWINIDGLGDTHVISQLGHLFNLHRLALEDVIHVHQRAKAEHYGHYYFVVARMPLTNQPGMTEQVSIFFGENFVLSFQEHPGGDCLNPLRERIRSGSGPVRSGKPDYLVYALLDAIVDHYFPIVEEAGGRLDDLEAEVVTCPVAQVMARIHDIKRDLLMVRRVIWPLRDALNTLIRDATPLITDETRVYLRDVHDHTIQILDLVEAYRDIASGLTEVYLSRVSQRTNEIMKVLTIIATIFIPLTFLVGVYGMNFDPDSSPWNMPELRSYWGYPLIWLVMILAAGVMLLFFQRRGWLGRGDPIQEAIGNGEKSGQNDGKASSP